MKDKLFGRLLDVYNTVESGNTRTTAVAEALDISQSLASNHLSQLEADGHLNRVKRGEYEVNE